MKKYLYFLFVALFATTTTVLTSCNGNMGNTTQQDSINQTEQNQNSSYETEYSLKENIKEEQPKSTFLGTWVYIQPENVGRAEKLIITLNDDETAVAKATVRGDERIFYGSWSEWPEGYITLTFSDAYYSGRSLLDVFIDVGSGFEVDNSVIRDGYLYGDYNMAKAKNPECRVKLEKVE